MAIRAVSDRSIAELMSLDGRCALVTGGTRGIGYAVAHRLAEAGAAVVIGDPDKVGAETAAAAVTDQGGSALGAALDVRDLLSVQEAVERAANEFGSVDILVNNAGLFSPVSSLQLDDTLWDEVLAINLAGVFKTSREVSRRMVDAGTGGVIVNICSTQSFRAGAPGLAHSTASKHGLVGLTRALALELGPLGIRVLAVAPTMAQTPGLGEMQSGLSSSGLIDLADRNGSTLPLGRVAQPDDVARVVLFAVSDMAMIMTGSVLLADAGAMTV